MTNEINSLPETQDSSNIASCDDQTKSSSSSSSSSDKEISSSEDKQQCISQVN
jgi:hypothetical protein